MFIFREDDDILDRFAAGEFLRARNVDRPVPAITAEVAEDEYADVVNLTSIRCSVDEICHRNGL